MQMMEPVAVANQLTLGFQCPFDHRGHVRKAHNELPPNKGRNSAKALQNSLEKVRGREAPVPRQSMIDLDAAREAEDVPFDRGAPVEGPVAPLVLSAHHLLPGEASWPNTSLRSWIDDTGRVNGDLGYEVNQWHNGVWLPGSYALHGRWKALELEPGAPQQQRYAFAAMIVCGRQFHDAHPAYSEWVTTTLDKIAEKLSARTGKGCGREGCPGQQEKPPPPYAVLDRLHALERRLYSMLVAPPSRWRAPLFTSRFARMLHEQSSNPQNAGATSATDG